MNEFNVDLKYDKRKYFRINDLAYLSYKVVTWADVRLSNSNPDFKSPVDKLTFKANLDSLSRELKPLYNVINSTNPSVARYLSNLDEKICILSEYILGEKEIFNDVEPQHVNIGGGGLMLVSDKPVITGAMLELKMKLLPEDLAICCYAKVISCTQTEEVAGHENYKIAVEFEFMDEDVRDLITRHVLVKEQALNSSA